MRIEIKYRKNLAFYRWSKDGKIKSYLETSVQES